MIVGLLIVGLIVGRIGDFLDSEFFLVFLHESIELFQDDLGEFVSLRRIPATAKRSIGTQHFFVGIEFFDVDFFVAVVAKTRSKKIVVVLRIRKSTTTTRNTFAIVDTDNIVVFVVVVFCVATETFAGTITDIGAT